MGATWERSYSAVWRPGTGEQRWWAGDPDNFASADAGFLSKGLRCVAIDRDHEELGAVGGIDFWNTDERLVGVWRPGSGEERWITGASVDHFKQYDDQYFAKGLRLRSIDMSDGEVSAVWAPGKGEQHWASGMTWSEFSAKDMDYFNKGLRVVALDVDDDHYFAVWRPGSGAQWCLSSSFDDFNAKNTQHMNEGLRLVSMDYHGGKYVGVWRPGDGVQYHYWNLTTQQFIAKDAELVKQGLRMVAIDMARVSVASSSPPSGGGGSSSNAHNLTLNENGHYSGAGGDSTWMYYTAVVASSDPAHGHAVTKVQNLSEYEVIVSHNGVSTGVLNAHASASFNAGAYEGIWSAELIGVQGGFAPPFLGIQVTA